MIQEKEALAGLLKKYDVPFTDKDLDTTKPIQPWRCNRKYVELEKMVSSNTLEHPCLLRFCHLTQESTSLENLLYREFDLAEFITGHKIVALHAAFTGGRSGSVIIKLDNGIVGSVEVGNLLPEDQKEVDRHEIIARRGVGSDIVVDTQLPQQSIYLMTKDGPETYKDTDSELYGLDEKQIERVRATFALLKATSGIDFHAAQDKHLKEAVAAALESNKNHKKIVL
ncbi:MAG: hypothetical protein J6Y31_06700 [Bacteroidales bacterium]|nr:hypothetical protein [Bacteroidales bacterium]